VAGGPVAGSTIATFMDRLIGFIIDAIILWVVGAVLGMVLGGFYGSGLLGFLVSILLPVIISAIYFVYQWTTRKQTVGQQLLNLQVVDANSGGALSQNQAITRWAFLNLPAILATVLAPASLGLMGGGAAAGGAGGLIAGAMVSLLLVLVFGLGSLIYLIWLAVQTNNDARKQGPHDKRASSLVVKTAKATT
jgi:hypothetical protein